MLGRFVKRAMGFKTVKENSKVLEMSELPSLNEANDVMFKTPASRFQS